MDFIENPQVIGGYHVWYVTTIVKGGREQIDGPYFTEAEALISADLMKTIYPFARAGSGSHCAAWNPDPRREIAIRDDAMALRMILAMQLGIEIPKQGAERAGS